MTNLGSALSQSGKPNEAIECFKQALAINEEVYGEQEEKNHPELARSLTNLGLAWDQLGYPTKAKECYERALHIMKKAYGEDHLYTQAIKHTMEQLVGRLEDKARMESQPPK